MTLLTSRISRFAVGAASALLFIATPELPAKAQDTWRPFTVQNYVQSWCMLRKIGHRQNKAFLLAASWHSAMDPDARVAPLGADHFNDAVDAEIRRVCPGHFTDSY